MLDQMRMQRVNFEAKYGIAALVTTVGNFLRDQLFSLELLYFFFLGVTKITFI